MRPAPAVSFLCADGGAWRGAGAALAGLTAAVLLRWGWSWLLPAQTLAPVAALGVGLSVAIFVWRRTGSAPRRLGWNTQVWQLTPAAGGPPQPGRVDVAIDLGPWMLLRFVPAQGRDVWLAVGAAAGAGARAALYAPLPSPGVAVAEQHPGA